jgi:ClpP class serine protease
MKFLEYLLSQPLLVTPEAFEAAVAIASRDPEWVPKALEGRKGAKVDGAESGMTRRDGVAVIPIVGPITRYADFFSDLCGGVTTEALARDLHSALDDPAVRSIVLSIDSPGGEAAGIGELAGMIRAANGRKPVVAYVGGQGCSAAYWLASAAGEVVCAEMSTLGSIGVVAGYRVQTDRPGVKSYEFVSSQSPNKRPDLETEKGRAEVQRVVDDLAAVFISAVAQYRGTTPEKVVSDFGAGGVLVGAKAVAAGMADRVGTFEEVVSKLAAGASPRRPTATAATRGTFLEGLTPMFKLWQKKNGVLAVQPHALDEGDQPASPDVVAVLQAAASTPLGNGRIIAAEPLKQTAESAEVEQLRKELAASRLETIKASAAGWYDALYAANRIVPAEKDAALAAFIQASVDDLAHPLPEGKKRVDGIQALYKARTPHTLDREQLAGDGAAPAPTNLPPGYKAVEPRTGADKPPTKERVTELMQHLVAAGAIGADALPK